MHVETEIDQLKQRVSDLESLIRSIQAYREHVIGVQETKALCYSCGREATEVRQAHRTGYGSSVRVSLGCACQHSIDEGEFQEYWGGRAPLTVEMLLARRVILEVEVCRVYKATVTFLGDRILKHSSLKRLDEWERPDYLRQECGTLEPLPKADADSASSPA